ncbi:MAG: hypothetical protein ACI9SZ_000836, partial [Candidatus Thalassarchaeaceae archaeon]
MLEGTPALEEYGSSSVKHRCNPFEILAKEVALVEV